MIYDHLYVRRLALATLAVLIAAWAVLRLYPQRRLPPVAPRTPAPEVVFALHDARDFDPKAAIWSPALIALPGPVLRRAPDERVGGLAPPLNAGGRGMLRITSGADPETPPAGIVRWSWLPELFGPPVFHPLPPTASPRPPAARLKAETRLQVGLPPGVNMDWPAWDLPAEPAGFEAVIFMDFDRTGHPVRVLLEKPTAVPELNVALVRQAYRGRLAAPRGLRQARLVLSR